jgi:antitoxin MazE
MPVIKKWGNSLALRIPAHFAAKLEVEEDTVVELSLVDGGLFVKPIHSKSKYSLSELLAGINDENRHGEIEVGEPRGAEIW